MKAEGRGSLATSEPEVDVASENLNLNLSLSLSKYVASNGDLTFQSFISLKKRDAHTFLISIAVELKMQCL